MDGGQRLKHILEKTAERQLLAQGPQSEGRAPDSATMSAGGCGEEAGCLPQHTTDTHTQVNSLKPFALQVLVDRATVVEPETLSGNKGKKRKEQPQPTPESDHGAPLRRPNGVEKVPHQEFWPNGQPKAAKIQVDLCANSEGNYVFAGNAQVPGGGHQTKDNRTHALNQQHD